MSIALQRNDLTAGLLAAAVHGFFVLLLVLGVSWQIHDPQPIMAELWQALPEPSRPAPPPPPPPEPAPLPKLAPAPEPKPQPVPDNKAADIALEKKKQKEKLLKQKQAQETEKKRRLDDAREMDLALQRETAQIEAIKNERARKLAEQKRREDEDMRRQMLEDSLAAETRELEAKAAAARRASEIAKTVALFKDMISAKVRGNTRLPDNLPGNPEVEFSVSVLPTGEIAKISLTKGSGNAAYDEAVRRGIEKSSPLPLPPDKAAAAEFKNLMLKHKARE